VNSLFYAAIQTLPLGVAVAIEFLGPLVLALSQSRRPSDFAWALLAAAGLAALMLGDWSSGAASVKGIAYALGAGGCWVAYIVAGKRAARAGRQAAVACGTTVAALCTVPWGFAHSGWQLLSPEYLPLAVAVAVLTSAIPYSLEMVALERLPARVFGILTSLEPVIAAASGFVLLHETLSLTQIAGILCVVGASFGVMIAERKGDGHAV
jgi:inner membrane transporter RhtA